MSLHPGTNMIAQVNLNSKILTAPQHLANFQYKWWESCINLIRKRKIFSRSQVKCAIVSLLQHNNTETFLQVTFLVFKRITWTFKVVWTLVLILASYYPNSFMLCKMLNWQQWPICSLAYRGPNSLRLQAWIQETSTKMLWEKAFPWERSCGDFTDPGHWHNSSEGHWRSLLPRHSWLMAQVHMLSLTFPQTHSCFYSHPSPPQAPQPHHSEGRKESFGILWRKQLKSIIYIQIWDCVNSNIQHAHISEKYLVAGLTSVFSGRREPCKPSTSSGKKGYTTESADPFRPWRNGEKPPEMTKLRLHQVVEQSTGWVFAERTISDHCAMFVTAVESRGWRKNTLALQCTFQGTLQTKSINMSF